MRTSVLSPQEVQALLSHLDKCPPRDNVIVRLMLQCGLRVGEVANLNIEHVWRSGFVHPAINLVRGTTKGHRARYVDMPEALRPLIAAHIISMQHCNPAQAGTAPLFIGFLIRRRLTVNGIERLITKLSRAALGRSINPHMLRHTYATIMLKHTNIRVVQELLGHARLNTTEIYTHVNSEDCKTAVNQAFTH